MCDEEWLPLRPGSVDLVISSMALHWVIPPGCLQFNVQLFLLRLLLLGSVGVYGGGVDASVCDAHIATQVNDLPGCLTRIRLKFHHTTGRGGGGVDMSTNVCSNATTYSVVVAP